MPPDQPSGASIPQIAAKDDPVCEHGTAMDVHCCNCHSGFLFDIDDCVCEFGGYMDSEIPRRNDLRRNSAAELAIRAAIDAVESMTADPRLTDAVVLLGEAKESVADFIDAVQRRRFVRVEDANVDQAPALASARQAPSQEELDQEELHGVLRCGQCGEIRDPLEGCPNGHLSELYPSYATKREHMASLRVTSNRPDVYADELGNPNRADPPGARRLRDAEHQRTRLDQAAREG